MRTNTNIAETYARDGFFFPIDVLGADEARADGPYQLSLLRAYTDRVLQSFDRLIRNDT